MRSRTTRAFWKHFRGLPRDVQRQAAIAYRQFLQDPRHPSLRFKKIHGSDRLVSVRVSLDYRAVGVRNSPDEILWFWIGPHPEYERLLSGA